MDTGTKLKQLRKEFNYSQKDVASALTALLEHNVSVSAISGYESNYRQPDIATLRALAGLFDTTLDYLGGNSDSRHLCMQTTGSAEYDLMVSKFQDAVVSAMDRAQATDDEITKFLQDKGLYEPNAFFVDASSGASRIINRAHQRMVEDLEEFLSAYQQLPISCNKDDEGYGNHKETQ